MRTTPGFASAFDGLPRLPEFPKQDAQRPVPDDAACFSLWDKYQMLPNIQRHSMLVAHVATQLAQRAAAAGVRVRVAEVRASALLHDLAKSYCVAHGGSHAQLGAAWAVAETGNYALAQGVLLHVWWPWALPEGDGACALPLLVLYADKRVRHDACVTLEERYADLRVRYGLTAAALEGIEAAYRQGQSIERALEARLGRALHEDSFDSGRVVHRA